MKALFVCMFGFLLLAPQASAQARYDTKLEDAVKMVVADRIGEIRLGLDPADKQRMATSTKALSKPSSATTWEIVSGDTMLTQKSFGSFQTFSDGSTVTREQRRAWSNKTVSRVINF